MARKILIGMVAVSLGIGLFSAGHRLGTCLARMDTPQHRASDDASPRVAHPG